MLRIERYKNTRHWAVYEGANLVVVTVYKRGAAELLRRDQRERHPLPRRSPSDRFWRAIPCGCSAGPTPATSPGDARQPRAARLP